MPKKKKGNLIDDYAKYTDVPEDRKERLDYIYKELKIKDKDLREVNRIAKDIMAFKKQNKRSLKMTFYIVPEGIGRPRLGFGRRFYVPNIQKFYDYMEWYIKENNLNNILIYSETTYDLKYYLPIPSDMVKYEKLLAELKIIRHTKKPDWDNLGKGTDMFRDILLDDSLVTESRVRKYYSFKPRIEVKITYYTKPTNSYHLKSLKKMKGVENLDV